MEFLSPPKGNGSMNGWNDGGTEEDNSRGKVSDVKTSVAGRHGGEASREGWTR